MKRLLPAALIAVLSLILALSGLSYPVEAQRGATPRPTRTKSTTTTTRATRTPNPNALSKEEATAALSAYAETVLGRPMKVTWAGGVSGKVSQTDQSADAQEYAAELATKTYYGTVEGGAASLSYGVGTLTGDTTIDVQGSSFGVYALYMAGSAPDAASALTVALQTFPGLADQKYTAYPTTTGYLWYAYGSASSIDPATRKLITIGEAAMLYIVPTGKGLTITATVGRGEFAQSLKP